MLSFPSLTIRRQLRSEEHALLLFIHAAVAHRRGHGGDFAMMKVKAHSGATDLHSLGNDATDESAKKALENSVPLCSVDFGAFDFPHLISFDISKSILAPEHGSASVWEKCSGDPRRATRRYIQSVYLADWHASASQGAMARYVLSSPHSSSLHELALVAELVREFSRKRPQDAGLIVKLFAHSLGSASQEASVKDARSRNCPRCFPVAHEEDLLHLLHCPHLPVPGPDSPAGAAGSGLTLLDSWRWITAGAASPCQRLGIFASEAAIAHLVSVKGVAYTSKLQKSALSFAILSYWVFALRDRARCCPFFSVVKAS